MKTRLRSLSLITVLAGALLVVQPATAFTVIDPTNLIQNMLIAMRTMQQIDNQVRQLQNEAQMLIHQARNLERLDYNTLNRLRSTLATLERLIAGAEGLAFRVDHLDQEFARLYPQHYAAAVSGEQMIQDSQQRWRHTLDGLHTAMRVQAQVAQNLSEDEGVLADLVGQSQSAAGALQATQATNQLLALQAKQAIQTQQLQLTQDRAMSLELARQAAEGERAREVRRRFLGEGTPYTPQTVRFYGQ